VGVEIRVVENFAETGDAAISAMSTPMPNMCGVFGLEEVEGDSFGSTTIDRKEAFDKGEAGLLFDNFRSESNGSGPCRSSVGVYRPFKLLDRNPPGPTERGVPVRDGCFAVEALESLRDREELVVFVAPL
jgi:hypothetical protein